MSASNIGQQNPKEYLLSRMLADAHDATRTINSTSMQQGGAKTLRSRRDSDLISDAGTYVVDKGIQYII